MNGAGGTGGPKHGEPRSQAETDGCYIDKPALAPRNANAFDLWAHAESWSNGRTAISNWKSQ
jgi:hypothetical protein